MRWQLKIRIIAGVIGLLASLSLSAQTTAPAESGGGTGGGGFGGFGGGFGGYTVVNAEEPGTVTVANSPSNVSVFFAPKRTEKGSYIGIVCSAATPAIREQLKLKAGTGLVVDKVEKDSPAERAGVKQYDVLQKMDDQWLINTSQFGVLVRMYEPGDKPAITLVRQGQSMKVTAEIVEKQVPALADIAVQPIWAKPGAGSIVMNGAVKPAYAGQAQQLLSRIRNDSNGQMQMSVTDSGVVSNYSVNNGSKHLKVTDASGNVLFDGPVDTEAQRTAMSETVKARYKAILDTLGTTGEGR